MPRPHDVGGADIDAPFDLSEHPHEGWQLLLDAVRESLRDDGLLRVDELRRATEDIPADRRRTMSYYERETAGLEQIAIERGWLDANAIDARAAEHDSE